MMLSVSVFAQKGKSEVGINVDVAPTLSTEPVSMNLGFGAKYRYGLSNRFRLDANFTYYLNSMVKLDEKNYDKLSMMDISVNVHYLIKCGNKMTFYPLAGLGYIKLSPDWNIKSTGNPDKDLYNKLEAEKDGPAKTNIVLNIGAGFDYHISDHLSANVELKYPVAVDVTPIPISLGVIYKF